MSVRAAVRAGVGLLVALLLGLWKPVLGAVAAGVALLLLGIALASPDRLHPRVASWIAAFARAVGRGVSHAVLTLVHLLVFLPLGLLLRTTGRLRIAPDPEPEIPTYWRPADRTAEPADLERQF